MMDYPSYVVITRERQPPAVKAKQQMSTTSRGPSRRTLVKGAAWSVPVVAVAGAAPAMAVSPGSVGLSFVGGCKLPGGSCANDPPWYSTKGYLFVFNYNNTNSCPVVITGWTITRVSGEFPSGGLAVQTGVTIQPGRGQIAIAGESNNSRDLTFTANMTVEWALDCDADGQPDTDDRYLANPVTVSVDSTKPCVNCDLPPAGGAASSELETTCLLYTSPSPRD